MKCKFELVHLPDGFMYGIDKTETINEGDYVYYQGCPEFRVVFKVKTITERSTDPNHPNLVCADGRDTNNKVIFTNNPDIDLPQLPKVEDWDESLSRSHLLFVSEKIAFVKGYNSALPKKYNVEDIKFAIFLAINYNPAETSLTLEEYVLDKLIKKPIAVEVSGTYIPKYPLSYRGCTLSDSECYCDASESSWCEHRRNIEYDIELKIIDNKVIIERYIYETN